MHFKTIDLRFSTNNPVLLSDSCACQAPTVKTLFIEVSSYEKQEANLLGLGLKISSTRCNWNCPFDLLLSDPQSQHT